MRRGRVLTLPNALTASRIALAPLFLFLYSGGDQSWALAVFALAAATDLLDGLAARVLHQYSCLGALLDPVADKVLAACALFALAARGELPFWFALFVVARDGALLAGAGVLRLLRPRVPIAPTRIGKYATFMLAATVLLALAGPALGAPQARLAPYEAALALVAAECVAVSFLQYALHFARALRGGGVRTA